MLNLSNIKTPGVYIDEVPKFPPSIAAVETAIPAFIGYTQFAENLAPGDLLNIPTRISSLADYQLYFGGAAPVTVSRVDLDVNLKFLSANLTSQFYMYDSLSMFFANGGGDCYIVSIGDYTSTPSSDLTKFSNAVAELEKYDEPTIILYPDAPLLGSPGLYSLQATTLMHCDTMKNRVGLFDTERTDYNGNTFRNNIGINNLKYGTVYAPWLQVALNKNVGFADIYNVVYMAGSKTDLSSLTSDATLVAAIAELKNLVSDVTPVNNAFKNIVTTFGNLKQAYIAAPTASKLTTMAAVAANLYSLAGTLNSVATTAATYKSATVITGATNAILAITTILETLRDNEAEIKAKWSAYVPSNVTNTPLLKPIYDYTPTASSIIPGTYTDDQAYNLIADELEKKFDSINAIIQGYVVNAVAQGLQSNSDSLSSGFPVYKSILNGINSTPTALPPSGTIAGIYAYTDSNRGVWKAPANVSIGGGATPDHIYTASELDRLNVDVVSGKSINAIRAFTGKGTLVYGARTLAGNDNEWRYISVRRFFCMVEDSVRFATQQFVFEPNDANTWVRVQSMIENFLTTLWRQGALQGATTDKAFYVAVGLGKTMTSVDILEGRLIIEIGMAAVRPAEFIILRFSHIMAEA